MTKNEFVPLTNREFILELRKKIEKIRDKINLNYSIKELQAVAKEVQEGQKVLEPINLYTFELDPLRDLKIYEIYIQLYAMYVDIYEIYQEEQRKGTSVKWLDDENRPPKMNKWKDKVNQAVRAIVLSGIGSGLVVGFEVLIKFILGHPSLPTSEDENLT